MYTTSRKYSVFFMLLAISPTLCTHAADTINTSQILRDANGDTLLSSRGIFEMGFFSPEGSTNRFLGIWYQKITVQTVVWVANRDNPLTDTSGVITILQPGTLSLLNATNATLWSTTTPTTVQTPLAQLLDSGNLILRDANDANPLNFIWQSFDYPTDTFLPGMKLGRNFVSGHEVYLTSWKSGGDPGRGNFTHHFDPTGYPQSNIEKGNDVLYKTGPWNGLGFSGLPILKKNNTIFTFGVVINENEAYYHYELVDESVITRFALSESGVGHRWIWVDRTQEWTSYFTLPVDNCDVYNECGPYGSCDTANNPSCGCTSKFEPKDPRGWEAGDYANGCIRRTALNCSKGDAFLKYSGVKLPDTQYSWYNETMSLDECGDSCLKNCSCVAYTTLNISSGNGCLLWFGGLVNMRKVSPGQDIYIRMASSELDSRGKKRKILAITMGTSMFTLCFGLLVYFLKRRKELIGLAKLHGTDTHSDEGHSDLEIRRFDLSTISAATDNFSSNNKVGEGGYGAVYKGELADGQKIAVKCNSRTSLQGVDEFMNEVRSITKLQHRSMVKLLGCCIEGEERMLVYEYLSNRSLDLLLFDPMRSATLDWPMRFNIISSVARGLVYLHEDSRPRVIHRDLKTANILLDSDMNPKISDFGLARIFGGDETGDITAQPMGTRGYIAPEYLHSGRYSVKSDVYSFGVIVLEIVSGQRNIGFPDNLLAKAWMLYREDRLEELVDPGLEREDLSKMVRAIRIGLLCVQDNPDERPSMTSVERNLSNQDVLPEARQPGVSAERQVLSIETSFATTTMTMGS